MAFERKHEEQKSSVIQVFGDRVGSTARVGSGSVGSKKMYIYVGSVHYQQEAQLSQRCRAMPSVVEYFG